MGPVVALRGPDGPESSSDASPGRPGRGTGLLWLAAVGAPVVVAAALIPWRDRLAAADNALILVVVIVAVATTGHRWAAAVCALSAALSFDFFLTRPYGSFRITRTSDLVTELLLLVVGLAVGELAARGRTHREAAGEGRRHLSALHTVTELAATGRGADQVAAEASRQLVALLALRGCRFTRDDPGLAARVLPDGEVQIGAVAWSTGDLGLPHRGVDLPVRGAGAVWGHFELVPEPGTRVPRELLVVAVAIADQVGAALAAEPDRVPRRR